ncbi:MAG TPA: type II toxin-antitoxin system VapC family toxin [Acidimicrobiia bacterium]|jgi:predicted nucleic acid-binding protein|nr:type II toxin-antitoxin system VapC family toxin [Acidimicrobiia bacterium]
MTRYVLDVGAALRLAKENSQIPAGHELLAPTLFRSQVLSALHESVTRGDMKAEVARNRLAYVGRLPMRLLGDAMLRRRAWELADQLGWASTYDAEYVALTQLQADAFVTVDRGLARRLKGVVVVAPIEELLRP